MTSPIPVTGTTAIYGLEYLLEGEPAFHHRVKLERNSKKLDTLLQAAGIAPPGAADLAAVAGRVTALEGTAPAAVPYVNLAGAASGWSDFTVGFRTFRYWRQGRTAFISGVVKNSVALAAGSSQVAARLPVGFRPLQTEMINASGNNATVLRADVSADGLVTVANNTASAVGAGAYIPINGFWNLD